MGLGPGILLTVFAADATTLGVRAFRRKHPTGWGLVWDVTLGTLIWAVTGGVLVGVTTVLLRRFPGLGLVIGPIAPVALLPYTLSGIYIGFSIAVLGGAVVVVRRA